MNQALYAHMNNKRKMKKKRKQKKLKNSLAEYEQTSGITVTAKSRLVLKYVTVLCHRVVIL
jgi:hypothetical protein